MYQTLNAAGSVAKPDAIVIGLFAKTSHVPAGYKSLDKKLGGAIADALKRPEFGSEAGQVAHVYPAAGARRVYVIGLGDKSGEVARAIRVAASNLVRAAARAEIKSLDVQLTPGLDGAIDADAAGSALGDGLSLGQFEFTAHKGAGSKNNTGPKSLKIAVEKPLRKAFAEAITVGEAVHYARTIAATPPNVCNPGYLVKQARKLAEKSHLKCTVIDAKRAKQMHMGGLNAVGSGGSTPPAIIALEHKPRGKAGSKQPIVLVGKSITFDTGGYSLKPTANMTGMKYDKCGGMAVLGAMRAIDALKLPVHVIGLLAAAENMIDTTSYRVDDILTMYNGVTVEVTNTDAEGRLVLADALAYGCDKLKPAAVIDLATLTGGVVVALGDFCAGLFATDDKLRDRLVDAGSATGERLWTLPLWPEHKKMMKSNHADIVNSAGRGAHAIQGAAFLSYFVDEKVPWAHLDIAGMADVSTDRDWSGQYAKGPTGFGVRLLTQLIKNWK